MQYYVTDKTLSCYIVGNYPQFLKNIPQLHLQSTKNEFYLNKANYTGILAAKFNYPWIPTRSQAIHAKNIGKTL